MSSRRGPAKGSGKGGKRAPVPKTPDAVDQPLVAGGSDADEGSSVQGGLDGGRPNWVQAVLGAFLGLAVAKFGNPAILDHLTARPGGFFEYVFFAWPLEWAYGLLMVVALACSPWMRWRPRIPHWLLWLPLAWLAWVALSATR